MWFSPPHSDSVQPTPPTHEKSSYQLCPGTSIQGYTHLETQRYGSVSELPVAFSRGFFDIHVKNITKYGMIWTFKSVVGYHEDGANMKAKYVAREAIECDLCKINEGDSWLRGENWLISVKGKIKPFSLGLQIPHWKDGCRSASTPTAAVSINEKAVYR